MRLVPRESGYGEDIESEENVVQVMGGDVGLGGSFDALLVFSFLKFFPQQLPDEDPSNLYMEREWRLLGDLDFTLDEVERVIVPHAYRHRVHRNLSDTRGRSHSCDRSPGVTGGA